MSDYDTWSDHVRRLVRALSRYIGYTAAAYDIDRLFAVLGVFRAQPSAYGTEVISSLQSWHDGDPRTTEDQLTDGYIGEALHFATALGILAVVSDRSTYAKKYAPTQTGRAIMGAREVGDDAFFQFFRTKIVLMADADAIVPTLVFSRRLLPARQLITAYRRFHHDLRRRRFQWLEHAFPDRRLRDMIVEKLPWVERRTRGGRTSRVEELSEHTARHHVTPRKQWLTQLGLVGHVDREVTQLGADVAATLVPADGYFWLGPPASTQDALHIPKETQGLAPFEDTLTLRREPRSPSASDVDTLVEATAEVMRRGYSSAKLVYAPQASLQLPIEYVAYRCYADGADYRWPEVLDILFRRYRSILERFSARRGLVGFYRLKENRQC